MTNPLAIPKKWLGSIEVDQRQRFIARAEKLQEMVGGSILIANTVELARQEVKKFKRDKIELIWPVSGVIRFSSPSLPRLSQLLWDLRTKFIYESGLPVTVSIVEQDDDLNSAFKKAEDKSRSLKDAPAGDDGSPFHPLFAPCSIQPELPANERRDAKEVRRRLISSRTLERSRENSQDYLDRFWRLSPGIAKRNLPHNQDDLVVSSSDSYVALIKADADGIGRLLPQLTTENASGFCEALDACIHQALQSAVAETVATDRSGKFPIIPIVDAGEDIWLLTARDIALPFAIALSSHFTAYASKSPVLQGIANGTKLTLSIGVLFSRQGFPVIPRLDLAEELLHGAKAYRRQLERNDAGEACLDYFWLQSSSRHSIEDARTVVADNPDEYHLHTKPWTITEAAKRLAAAAELHKSSGVPRRKLKQLDGVLRRGRLATVAYSLWLNTLSKSEKKCWQQALQDGWNWKDVHKPWQYSNQRKTLETPFLELAELTEILAIGTVSSQDSDPEGSTHAESDD